MHSSSICRVLLLAVTAQCVVVPRSHALHEKRELGSSKWIKREKVPASHLLPMRIGLKQSNLHRGHEFLMDVSHPESPSFAKHWTPEEVVKMFAPKEETVDAVRQWLVDHGISRQSITHSDNQGWLAFDATTEVAESLLHTKYHVFEDTSTGQSTAGCDTYHVPKYIQEHLDYITPGVRLLPGVERRTRKPNHNAYNFRIPITVFPSTPISPNEFAADPLSKCDEQMTPPCIRALYGIPEVPEYPYGEARSDNSLGIFEEADTYAQKDLDSFFTTLSPKISNGTQPILAAVDGAHAPVDTQYAGPESSLDLQLSFPLIHPQNITLFQTDDPDYAPDYYRGFFNNLLDVIDGSYCTYSAFGETGNDAALDPVYPGPRAGGYKGQLQCGVYKPTNVLSLSYGAGEIDLPAYYQQRQCNEYMKLGLQGISVIFSSGDRGVSGLYGDPNSSNSTNGCIGSSGQAFAPNFPVNCPYVTAVGSTQVLLGNSVHDPESATLDFGSGGGFSNLFSRPTYQSGSVSAFFDRHNPSYAYYETNGTIEGDDKCGIYNRAGRGYPDVAANGMNIIVFISGYLSSMGGTSASAPIFASLINRINEIRLNAGKNTLGFLNPTLYAHPAMFNDITKGNNPGCGTDGFTAVSGWDPVTGLGTPNYPKMRDFLTALP